MIAQKVINETAEHYPLTDPQSSLETTDEKIGEKSGFDSWITNFQLLWWLSVEKVQHIGKECRKKLGKQKLNHIRW